MISTIANWFRRIKKPTLSEITQTTIDTAESMNEALHELATCDCTENLRRFMDRARRMEGTRTRRED